MGIPFILMNVMWRKNMTHDQASGAVNSLTGHCVSSKEKGKHKWIQLHAEPYLNQQA